MSDAHLTLYILCGCTFVVLTTDFVMAWFFARTAAKIAALPIQGREAKGIIKSNNRSKQGQIVITYSFTTTSGKQMLGKQIFYSTPNGTYPVNSIASVIYQQSSPVINCLRQEIDAKLKSTRGFRLMAKLLPLIGCLVVAALWLALYKGNPF